MSWIGDLYLRLRSAVLQVVRSPVRIEGDDADQFVVRDVSTATDIITMNCDAVVPTIAVLNAPTSITTDGVPGFVVRSASAIIPEQIYCDLTNMTLKLQNSDIWMEMKNTASAFRIRIGAASDAWVMHGTAGRILHTPTGGEASQPFVKILPVAVNTAGDVIQEHCAPLATYNYVARSLTYDCIHVFRTASGSTYNFNVGTNATNFNNLSITINAAINSTYGNLLRLYSDGLTTIKFRASGATGLIESARSGTLSVLSGTNTVTIADTGANAADVLVINVVHPEVGAYGIVINAGVSYVVTWQNNATADRLGQYIIMRRC